MISGILFDVPEHTSRLIGGLKNNVFNADRLSSHNRWGDDRLSSDVVHGWILEDKRPLYDLSS